MAPTSSNLSPDDIVKMLDLQPHPEGGYFKETFRDSSTNESGRSASTAIYYLLKAGQFSSFHRIDAAEGWHHYAGGPLNIVELSRSGPVVTILGTDLRNGERPQYVVQPGNWFGAKPVEGTEWTLVGCTVAPGFEFEKFELGQKKLLLDEYGDTCKDWIEELAPST